MAASPTPAGQTSYDSLGREEQAVVRAEWDARATALRRALNLEAEFRIESATWVESDAAGLVHVHP